MKLTKDEFCGYIRFIQEQSKKETALCDALEAMTDSCYCDFFCYSSYQTKLVELLNRCMDIPEDNDIILYFICDLEYGKTGKNIITMNSGKQISLTTPEELYDYIVGVNNNEKV